MRWIMVILLAGALSPAAWGQQEGDRRGPSDGRPPGMGPGFRRGDGRWGIPPDDEEWGRIQKFMKEHSPRRWDALSKLNNDQQNRLKQVIWRRFRLLEMIKNNNDDTFYNLRVKRLETEDEIFGLTRDLRNASTEKEVEIRRKLKDAIGQLLDLGVQEHQARITRWEKLIADEKVVMDREKQDRETLIKKHMKAAERESGGLGDETATTQESADQPATTQSAAAAPSPSP
jgi:hypothetical protein